MRHQFYTVNGFWLVISSKRKDKDCDYVLCVIPHGEFSIHTIRRDNPKNLFWGHYHLTIESAMIEWNKL